MCLQASRRKGLRGVKEQQEEVINSIDASLVCPHGTHTQVFVPADGPALEGMGDFDAYIPREQVRARWMDTLSLTDTLSCAPTSLCKNALHH